MSTPSLAQPPVKADTSLHPEDVISQAAAKTRILWLAMQGLYSHDYEAVETLDLVAIHRTAADLDDLLTDAKLQLDGLEEGGRQ